MLQSLDKNLSADKARHIARAVADCILGQLHREYPCYEAQVLSSPDDLSLPRQRHPAFYGSFDWHSSVHSHWALVRLLASGLLCDNPSSQSNTIAHDLYTRAIAALDETFQPDLMQQEVAGWSHEPDHTELPYGLSWLLTLDAELDNLSATRQDKSLARLASQWRDNLAPLVSLLSERLQTWVVGLTLPIRSGIHSDTAWSLALVLDWAQQVGDAHFVSTIVSAVQRLYLNDIDAPCAYEPNAQTFTSPILNEAALMARVLEPQSYKTWLQRFLPNTFAKTSSSHPTSLLPDPPGIWDGSNYYGVHEVALPLARCIATRDAAAPLPIDSPAHAFLLTESTRWQQQGLTDITLSGYLADHWVGSFIVAAMAPIPMSYDSRPITTVNNY